MRSFILTLFVVFLSNSGFSQTADNLVLGKWTTEDSNARIEIYREGNRFSGKIVWLKEPNQPDGSPKVDAKNPDPNLRKNPVLGLAILTGLEYKDGEWLNGKIYAPRDGKSANCTLSMKNDKELHVVVSKSIFSTTKIWKRL